MAVDEGTSTSTTAVIIGVVVVIILVVGGVVMYNNNQVPAQPVNVSVTAPSQPTPAAQPMSSPPTTVVVPASPGAPGPAGPAGAPGAPGAPGAAGAPGQQHQHLARTIIARHLAALVSNAERSTPSAQILAGGVFYWIKHHLSGLNSPSEPGKIFFVAIDMSHP